MSSALLATILSVVVTIMNLYTWVVIAAVIASWLIAFGVVNTRNEVVRAIVGFLYAATEPVFRQIRRVIPAIGGLDLSPLVVLLAVYAIEYFIVRAFPDLDIRPLL